MYCLWKQAGIALPLCAVAMLALQGCVIVGVDYRTPETTVPDAWTRSVGTDVAAKSRTLEKWWTGFNDPVLNDLIRRTRNANPNLKLAAQNIAEARALRGVVKSQLFPQANSSGSRTRNRSCRPM